MKREIYQRPTVERIRLSQPITLLLQLSLGTSDDGLGDFEDDNEAFD